METKRNQKVKKRNATRQLSSDTKSTRRQKDEKIDKRCIIIENFNKFIDLHDALGTNFDKLQQPKQQLTNISLEYLTSPIKDSCRQNSTLDWMMQLVETNMRAYYEACPGWGWDSKAKRSELEDGLARFIIAYCPSLGTDSPVILERKGDSTDGNGLNTLGEKSNKDTDSQPEGFAHIRYEIEEDMPIIYIYEIQIAERAQGRGLGKYIMRTIEDIAKTNGISAIMLTVFSRNKPARKLYESIGYSKHKSSPDPETGYIILSKPITR
eukprot:jgi/Picsp_1/6255/NSC_03609-R1_protein